MSPGSLLLKYFIHDRIYFTLGDLAADRQTRGDKSEHFIVKLLGIRS